MKSLNKFAAVLLFAAFIAAIGAFTACSGGNADVKAEITERAEKLVVIKAEATGGSLFDAMKKLKAEGKLEFEGSDGDYGFFLTSVGGYAADASKNEYWAIYTTLGEYEGVTYSDAEYGRYDYKGSTCFGALYGASGMPMVEGQLYILTVQSY